MGGCVEGILKKNILSQKYIEVETIPQGEKVIGVCVNDFGISECRTEQ